MKIMPYRDESLLVGVSFTSTTMHNFHNSPPKPTTRPLKPPKIQKMSKSSRFGDTSSDSSSSSSSSSSDSEGSLSEITPLTKPTTSQKKTQVPPISSQSDPNCSCESTQQLCDEHLLPQYSSISKAQYLLPSLLYQDGIYHISNDNHMPDFYSFPNNRYPEVDEQRGACGTIICTIYRYLGCV